MYALAPSTTALEEAGSDSSFSLPGAAASVRRPTTASSIDTIRFN
eukprot:SAG31_NODE_3749_length_3922_cov_1.586144_5_plen_45_part_00